MMMAQNHIHALATAFASLGGFQDQPKWFKSIKNNYVWQIFCLSVLIYQGGGNLDFMYSLSVAALFFTVMHFSNYLQIDFIKIEREPDENKDESENDKPEEVQQIMEDTEAENESESFFGYATY